MRAKLKVLSSLGGKAFLLGAVLLIGLVALASTGLAPPTRAPRARS